MYRGIFRIKWFLIIGIDGILLDWYFRFESSSICVWTFLFNENFIFDFSLILLRIDFLKWIFSLFKPSIFYI